MIYRERVLPSVWNLALPLILFPSVLAVMLPLNAALALPIAVVCTGAFLALQFFSSPVIEIEDSQLTVKGATINLDLLGTITEIPKDQQFSEMGRNLDARAWLAIQASVKGLVKIELDDSKDTTPYWLVSTRNPKKLISALKRDA